MRGLKKGQRTREFRKERQARAIAAGKRIDRKRDYAVAVYTFTPEDMEAARRFDIGAYCLEQEARMVATTMRLLNQIFTDGAAPGSDTQGAKGGE